MLEHQVKFAITLPISVTETLNLEARRRGCKPLEFLIELIAHATYAHSACVGCGDPLLGYSLIDCDECRQEQNEGGG